MAQDGHLPFSNTRLLLQEELENEDGYYLAGTVVRLHHSATSHPAVRQTLQGLYARRISLGALAVQALVNKRGPDGIVGVIPGEEKHSARLLSLCQSCHERGEVLACTLPSADMVLVPRLPSTAVSDGLYFLAYATNIRAVELCERLRQQKQVALVLDLDNTLVDAVSCSIAPNDWPLLDWRYVLVTNSYGRQIQAQYAPLPGHDPFSDDVWVMHWKVGRMNCTFKVRIRRGWDDLREFLAQNADKFAVFVCSKGKREYIQLLWLMLDPHSQLIPEADWDTRLTSTFPDTLTQAANKTALTALGCYDITKPHVATQLALPMMCLDDSTEAYEPEYDHSIMFVQEYRPSDLLEADNGNVLRQARGRLQAFWTATCTSDGTFAWQAAQSFAMALMQTMQRNPMGSPDDLSYLQVRCAKQGEALWHQFTVREVFGEDGVFIADDPGKEVPRSSYVTADALLCATCQLPECKPGCPGSSADDGDDEVASGGGGGGSAAGLAAAAADDAALSEGRSSEDSILLGLPSPISTVLPPPEAALQLGAPAPAAAAAAAVAAGAGLDDSSPTAEPRPKQQRVAGAGMLGAWEVYDEVAAARQEAAGGSAPAPSAPIAPEPAGPKAALAPACHAQSAHSLPARREEQRGQQQAAAPLPAAAAAVSSSESALAAALRGISRGLAEEQEPGSVSSRQRDPPLPQPRSASPAGPPGGGGGSSGQQAAAAGGGGGGGANSALAAALASISKGLLEDGLL